MQQSRCNKNVQYFECKYFTLIELLVTIGIIAILASMLLPALNRARDYARMAECMNNQRQCNLAMSMYMDDYNEWFVFYNDTAGGTRKLWAGLLLDGKYLTKLTQCHCPLFSTVPSWDKTSQYQTFAVNHLVNFKYAKNGNYELNKISPSRLFILGDGIQTSTQYVPWTKMEISSSDNQAVPAAWHSSQITMGFYDGHVAAIKPLELSKSSNSTKTKSSCAIQYFYDKWGGYWYTFSSFVTIGNYTSDDRIFLP